MDALLKKYWKNRESMKTIKVNGESQYDLQSCALEYSETRSGRWFTKIDNATPAVHFISSREP